MPPTVPDLAALAASHDIISLGMHADDVRRRLHGARTTFVRVAQVTSVPGAPIEVPAAAGEVRITGRPASRADAMVRVTEVKAAAGGRPLSGFVLSDLEQLSATARIKLRALLEELCAAGLELVAEAPLDRLHDAHRSIEEVNIAGLALARLTVTQLQESDSLALFKNVSGLQRRVAVVRSFAPLPRQINLAVPTTGYEDVKRVALARIAIDNIPSIQ